MSAFASALFDGGLRSHVDEFLAALDQSVCCLVLACQVDGRSVTTIEGLSRDGNPTPLQKSFVEEGAVQCGFCTPGMILSATALLKENPSPSEAEIRTAVSGNLCRCTGYTKIIKAIQKVSEKS